MSSGEGKALDFTARLVGGLCVARLARVPLGVFAENLPPMSTKAVVEAVAEAAEARGMKKLRLALLGGSNGAPKRPKGVELTTDPLVANQWRNDEEARRGTRLITIALGPATKLNSLRTALHPLGVKDIRAEIARMAYGWMETPERRNFWRALSDRSRDIPTTHLLEYAAELAAVSHRTASLLDAEPASVFRLRLLKSESLMDSSGVVHARKALVANLKLVDKLANLNDKQRRRLIELTDEPEHQRVAQAVLKFAGSGAREDLKSLSVDEVRAVLRAQPKQRDEDDEDDEDGGGGGDFDGARHEKVEGDALAVDLLLAGGVGTKAAAERFAKAIEPDDEGDIDVEEIKVGHRTVEPQPREGTTQSTALFAAFLDSETWGGLVLASAAADFVSAIKMAVAGDAPLVKFRLGDQEHVRGMVARAVDIGIVERDALDALDAYVAARERLLVARQPLLDHPLLAVAGSPKLAQAVGELLETYGAALKGVQRAAESLIKSGSVEPGRRLMARMLSVDVVFVQTREEWLAVAAPTHPFHLWRVHALLEVFKDHLEELKVIGDEALKEVISDPHAIAPHLVLSPYAAQQVSQAQTLVSAGSFGALPMFAIPEGRQSGRVRILALAALADRLMRLMPHAAMGLRVALVDPPSVAGTLEKLITLSSPIDDEAVVPLHATILRTRPPPEATDEEDEKLGTIAKELTDAGGSLAVRPNLGSLEGVAEHLKQQPAHLTAIFDPGEARVVRLGAVRPPPLSPLTLTRSYSYDAFDDRIDVIISGDVPLFSAYHELFCRTIDVPTGDLLGRRSGASQAGQSLERVAQRTMWLSVIDQGVEPTFRIRGAERLDWRQDAGRDIVTVTAHPETIDALIHDVIRLAGLAPTEERVKRTVRELFELSGEAILAPLRPRPERSLAEPRFAKGLIGALTAARWYQRVYPNALVISLDDPMSRRWILGAGPDDRHGDLLAVRPDKSGEPILEVLEIKTHDDAAAASIHKKSIEGAATVQVDQTIDILGSIIGGADSPVARARKDILRDQLYRAVASRPYKPADRRQFVNVLEELFTNGAKEICGLVFDVKIEPGGEPLAPSAPTYHRSSAGHVVGHVELKETGDQRDTPPPKRPSAGGKGGGGKGGGGAKGGGGGKGGAPSGGGEPDDTPPRNEPPEASVDAGAEPESARARTKRERRAAPEPPSATSNPTPEPSPSTPAARLRVHVGHTPTGTEVVWDPHDPERPLNNFGFLVTGDPGAGKTQILRALIHEIAKVGLPVCAFDYKNDYADPEFSKGLGLAVYDVNREGLPFNPLELVPGPDGRLKPITQIHELAGILKRVFGLGDQMEAQLRNAMKDAYEARGINAKSWITVDDAPAVPSFDEVVELLNADEKNEKLLNRLSPLFDLDLFPTSERASTSFDDLLKKQVVLLLNGLPNDHIKQAVSEFIIVRLHGQALRGDQPRVLRRLLVFDEAWRVKDSDRLKELAREGRAFGIGIAIGTQFPGDLDDDLTGNLATQLLLFNQNTDHRKSVIRTLNGTTSGRDAQLLEAKLQTLQKHEGFFRNQQYAPYILVMTTPHYQRAKA
jgi:hypothetical protein